MTIAPNSQRGYTVTTTPSTADDDPTDFESILDEYGNRVPRRSSPFPRASRQFRRLTVPRFTQIRSRQGDRLREMQRQRNERLREESESFALFSQRNGYTGPRYQPQLVPHQHSESLYEDSGSELATSRTIERIFIDDGQRKFNQEMNSVPNIVDLDELIVTIDKLAENHNIPDDIKLNIRSAFSTQGAVNYRLRVDSDKDTCMVFINEHFIIVLKGLDKDPHAIGINFLTILNKELFNTDLNHIGITKV